DLAHAERGVGVAVHPVDVRGHVDVDDVALLQDGRIRDAVADDLVEAGAARLGEALVAEGGRVGAVVAEERVHHPVDLVGGHPRLAVLTGELHRLRGEPAGDPHLLDRLRGLHVRTAILLRPFPPDVFGTRDVRRHGSRRRDRAGGKRSTDGHAASLSPAPATPDASYPTISPRSITTGISNSDK